MHSLNVMALCVWIVLALSALVTSNDGNAIATITNDTGAHQQLSTLSEVLAKKCSSEKSISRSYHLFFYSCMYDSEATPETIVSLMTSWGFCCEMQGYCNSTTSDCNAFICECLSLVNKALRPQSDSCQPKLLNDTCYDYIPMNDDTPYMMKTSFFARIVNRNLVLGFYGIISCIIFVILGLGGIIYFILCVLYYKFHKNAETDYNEVYDVPPNYRSSSHTERQQTFAPRPYSSATVPLRTRSNVAY